MRTLARSEACSPGNCDNAVQTGGAPGTTVTLRSRIVSTAVDGSKRCTRTIDAPRYSEYPSITLRPKMWNTGSTPYTTSLGRITVLRSSCSRFDFRLRCVSIAARGAPAVPLVKISAAVAEDSTSTISLGEYPSNDDIDTAPAMSVPSVATTSLSLVRRVESMLRHVLTAAGSTKTAVGFTTSISRSISAAGLMTFIGTATAPTPSVARYATTKVVELPHTNATASPLATPAAFSAPRTAPT